MFFFSPLSLFASIAHAHWHAYTPSTIHWQHMALRTWKLECGYFGKVTYSFWASVSCKMGKMKPNLQKHRIWHVVGAPDLETIIDSSPLPFSLEYLIVWIAQKGHPRGLSSWTSWSKARRTPCGSIIRDTPEHAQSAWKLRGQLSAVDLFKTYPAFRTMVHGISSSSEGKNNSNKQNLI